MVAGAHPAEEDPVVVTGVGLSTSLGFGAKATWERMLGGHSAIAVQPPEMFPLPVSLPVRLGARLDRDQLSRRIKAAVPRAVWNTSEPLCHLWLVTALEALGQAGLGEDAGPPGKGASGERVGVFVGTGAGATDFIEGEYLNIFTAKKAVRRDVSRMAVPKYMASSLAAQLSILKGFRGPSLTVNTACSSGATALVLALDALRLGRIDRAVAGGVELPLVTSVLKGFSNLSALSTRSDLGSRACRPFQADRDGMVLGEGGGCLVLERRSCAERRGAEALALFRGGAHSSEAHHLLSPREGGEAMADNMELALADAALDAPAVAHVYSHGTGTRYNDLCEAAALGRIFPHRPTVSATKAQLGHTIGAAGAIDAALAVLSLRSGQVVPLAHLEQPDPACPINAAREPSQAALSNGGGVLVNSFAFGGHNTTLAFLPA